VGVNSEAAESGEKNKAGLIANESVERKNTQGVGERERSIKGVENPR